MRFYPGSARIFKDDPFKFITIEGLKFSEVMFCLGRNLISSHVKFTVQIFQKCANKAINNNSDFVAGYLKLVCKSELASD